MINSISMTKARIFLTPTDISSESMSSSSLENEDHEELIKKRGVSSQSRIETILPIILPWLMLSDVVKISMLSNHYFRFVQRLQPFWYNIDFGNQKLVVDDTLDKMKAALSQFTSSSLAEKGKLIRHMSFAFNQLLNDDHMDFIPSNLIHLNLNGCNTITDTGLIKISKRCQKLQILEIYWNTKITDNGLAPIIKASRFHLRYVNVSGCSQLSNGLCSALVLCAGTLSTLDATRLHSMTEVGVMLLGESLRKLTTLRLYANHHLSRLAFSTLCRLHQLKYLDLSGCKITDVELIAIAKGCPCLETLILSWCIQITDESLYVFATQGQKLKTLSLHGVKSITAASIRALSRSNTGKTLEEIDVRGCPKLTPDFFGHDNIELKRLFPHVRCFSIHGEP